VAQTADLSTRLKSFAGTYRSADKTSATKEIRIAVKDHTLKITTDKGSPLTRPVDLLEGNSRKTWGSSFPDAIDPLPYPGGEKVQYTRLSDDGRTLEWGSETITKANLAYPVALKEVQRRALQRQEDGTLVYTVEQHYLNRSHIFWGDFTRPSKREGTVTYHQETQFVPGK